MDKATDDLSNLVSWHSMRPYTWAELYKALDRFWTDLDHEAKHEGFYHYTRKDISRLTRIKHDWKLVLTQFPSSEQEVFAAIDCDALRHHTACVFHMMRVAELGMRALAKERQVTFPNFPLEWAEWENVIDQIESKAKAATTGMSRGPAKDAAKEFYTNAVARLRAFKEMRNRVMHMRGQFDDLDSERAIRQVHDFMNGLSGKIGEKTKRPIARWP